MKRNLDMANRFTRRGFLAGLGALAVERFLTRTGLIRAGDAHAQELGDTIKRKGIDIEVEIFKHFAYLTLDAENVKRYADAYIQVLGQPRNRTDIHTRFLMSSNFFQSGADESKPVRFIMLYQRESPSCFNPLARLD